MQTLATDDFDAVSRDLANAEPKPTHASVIIGWTSVLGRNGNQPVWLVRNTRGESFGMKGDFMVPRGSNAYHIESDILAFEVEMV